MLKREACPMQYQGSVTDTVGLIQNSCWKPEPEQTETCKFKNQNGWKYLNKKFNTLWTLGLEHRNAAFVKCHIFRSYTENQWSLVYLPCRNVAKT